MNKIFVLLSVAIVLLISATILFQVRKDYCTKKKGEFIKQNLPESYGPDSFDRRLEDTRKINEVYNSCMYPWK